MKYSLQDLAATLVSLLLSGGIIALAVLQLEIPEGLWGAEGAVITWLFVRSTQAAVMSHNGHHD